MENKKILKKQADTIRFLAADMVQRANSGHPGAPMGLADIVTVLARHITHNPKNPKWLNRDRLVFSGGHASALIYSFLHLTGYDVSIDDLKQFMDIKDICIEGFLWSFNDDLDTFVKNTYSLALEDIA